MDFCSSSLFIKISEVTSLALISLASKAPQTCVVFDLDDTLYPEHAFVSSALAATGKFAEEKWGLVGMGDAAQGLFHAGQRKELFQQACRLLGHGEMEESKVQKLLEIYRGHRPESLPWFPDALEAIELLKPHTTLGLISDGYLPTQRNKAEALGVQRWIPEPIFTEELGRQYWKPSPRAFELMMQRHPGLQYLYIADNPAKDFVAPNLLGWKTVQILRPEGQYQSVSPAVNGEAQIKLTDLREVVRHL